MMWSRLVECCVIDPLMSGVLDLARSKELPNWAITGGAVRDLVWSKLSGNAQPPADIDLIYLDNLEKDKRRDVEIERHLKSVLKQKWNVKNQARFAHRHGLKEFASIHQSMAFAPATVSSIGVSQLSDGRNTAFSVYGLRDLFEMRIRPSPRYLEENSKEDFAKFVEQKGWLTKWPDAELCI